MLIFTPGFPLQFVQNPSFCKRVLKVLDNEKRKNAENLDELSRNKVKFEVYGEEMLEKTVKQSGNSGRVYLPPTWVGHHVKIIRVD